MTKVWVVEEINSETNEIVFQQYYDTLEAANAEYEERKILNESTQISLRKAERRLLTE